MRTIWKFPLRLEDIQTVMMPGGAVILSVQAQHGVICIWAIVETTAIKTTRSFSILGTGHDASFPVSSLKFLGTVLMGAFVWHVFENL